MVKDSLTHRAGLLANDFLISIANKEVFDMSHDQVSELSYEATKCEMEKRKYFDNTVFQAERTIKEAGDRFTMVIER